jgi:CcmD family protein
VGRGLGSGETFEEKSMPEIMGFKNAIFLVLAYGVFWLGTFIYVLTMSARQRNLEKDLEALEALVKKDQ